MKIHNIWYLIKQGFKNVFNNRMMSFSCVGVLVACMLLIGGSVLFTMTVNNLVGSVEKNSEVRVVVEDSASVNRIDEELSRIQNIAEIDYISKEQALEELKTQMDGGRDLLTGLEGSENPLPNTYKIRVLDVDEFDKTVEAIAEIDGVEAVQASSEVATILSGIKRTVYYAGVGIVAILILVSLAIITNTIKITIFSRRREINIMKYVGATDTFIRLPFLVEGVVIGLISAILAFLVLAIGYPNLLQWAQGEYGKQLGIIFSSAANFDDVAMTLLGGFSAIGASIGFVSSTFFVRKHLRV